MPNGKARPPKIKLPSSEPSLNLVKPPSNLKRCTEIKVAGQVLEINPDNVKTVKDLGNGAYGFVELIQHEPSGVQLAVKRINVFKLPDHKLLRDMEVLVKSLGCPHIVEFYGAIYWEDTLCLYMEILDASLDKFYKMAYKLPREPNQVAIPESVLGKVAACVVKALHYLHQQKIIHRDVKPSNILINRSGQIKLCDFGISGYLVNSVANTFEAGCKPYMAPERLMPDKNGYDIRSDVWSLGLSLFEIATGEFPYSKKADLFKQMKSIYQDDPPRLPPDLYSEDCHNFITKCLEKDHKQRPNYVQLLQYPLIITYQDSDISEFVARILDLIKAES